MRRFIYFFFCVILSVKGYTQQNAIDRVQKLLVNAKEDTNRVKLLQALGFENNDTNPDSSIHLQQRALHLARKLNFKKGELVSIAEMGFLAMSKGDYPMALELAFNALRQSDENGYDSLTAEIYNNIGLVYLYMSDFQTAKKYFLQAEAMMQKGFFKLTDLFIRGNLGRTYLKLEILDSALRYCSDAYRIAHESQLLVYQPIYSIALGEIYEKLGSEAVAGEYYKQAVAIAVDKGKARSQIRAIQKLAEFYYKTRLDSALIYGWKALSISQKGGYLPNVMEAASLLSKIFDRRLQKDSAYKYLLLSVSVKDEIYNREKQSKMQSLVFSQLLNELEAKQKKREAEDQRRQNLQYTIIALGIVSFAILFILFSHSIAANPKLIRFFGVVALLIFFEFLNLLLHPYLGELMHHSPILMLLAMVCIAALLVPLHHRLESWVTHRMVEKNNKIRLAAAKKIVEQLEAKVKEQSH